MYRGRGAVAKRVDDMRGFGVLFDERGVVNGVALSSFLCARDKSWRDFYVSVQHDRKSCAIRVTVL